MRMRRVMTALVLAGAIALAFPSAMFAQHGGGHAGGFSGGGHAGGFSGGHVGGFSGGHVGGFAGPRFGAPSGGFARSFPAPRMSFMPGPVSSGPTRFAPALRPYGGLSGTRSPFGQLRMPAVPRAPYPGAGDRSSTNQPYHSGNNQWGGNHGSHGGDHNGNDDHRYRRPYYGGVTVNSWPYYYYYPSWYWPWWPYFGDWDSSDSYPPDSTTAPTQPEDQYYAPPEQEPQYPQSENRPLYQPGIIGSPGVAISEPAVTIIYKDGHAEQVHNYALTPTKLLMMDNAAAGVSLQVPLSLIDLAATEQVNRTAGVDFRLPVRNKLPSNF
jgi:hypothetical protein